MRLSEVALESLAAQATGPGIVFRAGRFSVRLKTRLGGLIANVHRMYADHPLLDPQFADFSVCVDPVPGLRRWIRPQVQFSLDGDQPFSPLPLAHAYPLLEWGLNWCVSNHCHQYLIVHAAVLEKRGRALILPGSPGAGKSTLAAALSCLGGWRLLSDELTLIDLKTGMLHPNTRPISLKNESIDLIQSRAERAVFTQPVRDTLKGTVAHIRPDSGSVTAVDRPAPPGLIVFPTFKGKNTPHETIPLGKGSAFMRMAENSFNYSILGLTGFRALCELVERSDCYEYPNGGELDKSINRFDELAHS